MRCHRRASDHLPLRLGNRRAQDAAINALAELEPEPRGAYTGSMGWIEPGGDAAFNVLIRTLEWHRGSTRARLGLGSGLVVDSEPSNEWAECRLKGAFVERERQSFDLIETMRFDPHEGLLELPRHLDRLAASAEALDFRFDRIQSGNTFDAHRLLHLAGKRGRQDALKERLLRAYFTEGEPIGEPQTLVRLSTEVGLDTDELTATLASDALTREVRADEDEARALGINGVPFFVFAGRYAVSGAQPPEVLLRVLERTIEESVPSAKLEEGAACGPEDCA